MEAAISQSGSDRRQAGAHFDAQALLSAIEAVAAEPTLTLALGRVAALGHAMLGGTGAAIAVTDLPDAPARLVAQAGHVLPGEQVFRLAPADLTHPQFVTRQSLSPAPGLPWLVRAMICPLRRPGHPLLALLIFFAEGGPAGADDDVLLARAETLLRAVLHPLLSLTLAERAAHLSSLIDGHPPEALDLRSSEEADRPLHVVSLAMSRLTRTQALALNQINAVLGAGWGRLDGVILEAMTFLCAQSGADRAVIVERAENGQTKVTHGWSSPAIGPLMQDSKGFWERLDSQAVARLAEGVPLCWSRVVGSGCPFASLPDATQAVVICPIREGDKLAGMLCIEFREVPHGFFLPGEIHLLQSMAHAIGAALLQRRTAEQHNVARDAVQVERMRLQSTLSALPDLVVELDGSGRFVAHYSQENPVLARIGDRLIGQTLEEAVSTEVAAAARALLAQLATTARVESAPFLHDVGDGDLRWVKAIGVRREPGIKGRLSQQGVTILILRDVTREVTQAQEITRLGEVAKRTQNLVVMTDAERRVTWVNTSFERVTGWQLHEVIGRVPGDFLDAIPANGALTGDIRSQLAAGLAVQAETVLVTRAGRKLWVANDIQPIRDAQGAISGYIGVLADITQRREQEAALAAAATQAEEARARLIAAVNALEDGFVVFDKEGVLVLCNQHYKEILPELADVIRPGVALKDILRRGVELGVYASAKGDEEQWLADRMMLARNSGTAEVQLSDGRWIRSVDRATPDGGWVGLRVDITELKRAAALARSDRQAAMDAAHDGMAISAPDGKLLYANKAFLSQVGIAGDLPPDMEWRAVLGDEAAARIRDEAEPVLQSGTPHWRGLLDLARERGPSLQVEISLTLRQDGAMVWVVRDLTDEFRHEQERLKLREELQLAQRREVIGQLAAGLAHDFNNLIAAISGSALLIKDEAAVTMPVRAHAERILKSAGRAEGMVRKLLALGTRSREFQRLPLAPVLTEAAELLRPALPRSMRLMLVADQDTIEADIEPTDLLQVILNLGVNARDALFARERSDHPMDIRLSLCRAAGAELEAELPMAQVGQFDPARHYASLCVSDSGDGIAEDQAQTIFTPYFSTKGDKGTGLGLAIVSSVIQGMGGVVRLHRSDLGGAEFRVFLPLPQQDEQPAVLAGESGGEEGRLTSAAPVSGGAPLAGKSIMVVDDVEEVLEVLAAVLERAGAEVAPTSDPEAALEVLAEDPAAFDLVITDFDMGGLTGADLSRRIRQMRPELPVILITALTDWRRRDRAASEQSAPLFHAVIGKPVAPEKLVNAAISALISRHN